MHQERLREWLRSGLKPNGKTQVQLAKLLGLEQPDISKMIHGKRKIQSHEIPIIANYIGVAPPNSGMPEINIVPVQKVAVWYTIERDAYRRGDPMAHAEGQHIPVVQEDAAQYGVQVTDSSASFEVLPGAYAICIPIGQLDREPRDGDLLHINHRDSEGKTEHTLRLWSEARGSPRLVFPCPDPGPALDPESPDVDIVGIVTGIYTRRII